METAVATDAGGTAGTAETREEADTTTSPTAIPGAFWLETADEHNPFLLGDPVGIPIAG